VAGSPSECGFLVSFNNPLNFHGCS